jgi:hypothetical protein
MNLGYGSLLSGLRNYLATTEGHGGRNMIWPGLNLWVLRVHRGRELRYLIQEARSSVVVIQIEFVRVWPQPDGIDLLLALIRNPGLNEIVSENVAARQERMVLF